MTRVGFVGAGRIGGPMVRRLLGGGAKVSVFTRRPETRRLLEESGAVIVDDVACVAAGNDIVISCVYSDDQLCEVADQIVPALEQGAILVSHTTGSPETVRALAERARARGADVVEASFSGTADDVLAGRLTVLLGGREDSLDRCEPLLRSYAGTVLRTGSLGSALVLKLVNNMLFAANVQLALEVDRVTRGLGVPLATALEVLAHSSGGTTALRHLAAFPDAETYADQVRPFMVKDVAVCEEVAAAIGVDLGLLGEVVHGGRLAVEPE